MRPIKDRPRIFFILGDVRSIFRDFNKAAKRQGWTKEEIEEVINKARESGKEPMDVIAEHIIKD